MNELDKNKETLLLMSETELKETKGGWIIFIGGIVTGYIVGEILEGIYQADKRGCI